MATWLATRGSCSRISREGMNPPPFPCRGCDLFYLFKFEPPKKVVESAPYEGGAYEAATGD